MNRHSNDFSECRFEQVITKATDLIQNEWMPHQYAKT